MPLIHENIRRQRILVGLSQEYVASQLNISQPNYCEMEAGKRKVSTDRLEEISKVLQVPVNTLLNSPGSTTDEYEREITYLKGQIEFNNKMITYQQQLLASKDEIISLLKAKK